MYRSFWTCFAITITVSLGTFNVAYCGYILNGTLTMLKKWLQITTSLEEGFLSAAFNTGGLIGCMVGLFLMQRIPRRKLVFLIDFLFVIGSAGQLIQNYYTFLFCHLINGAAAGLSTLGIVVFLKELLPVKIYGILSGQNTVMLSIGTLAQSLIVLAFPVGEIDISTWRIYLMIPISVSCLRQLLFLFYFRFESPVYNVSKGNQEEALKYITFLYDDEQQLELSIIEKALQRRSEKKINSKRLILGITTNILYPLSGITPIITYSTSIFKQVTTESIARYLTIGMGVLKFLFYSSGAQITQKFGRRNPLVLGTGFLAIILISTGWSSYANDNYADSAVKSFAVIYSIVAIYLYFTVFFNSFGTIIPIYSPEILSGNSLALAQCCKWVFNIIVMFLFPIVNNELGICYTFFGFGVMMTIGFAYFWIFVKETQGLNELQINKLFSRKVEDMLIQ